MATKKQIEANKCNAVFGGVKTKEGKKISRMNATKHGFFSKLLTDEEKKECDSFCNEMYDYFSPANAYEGQFVEVILSTLFSYRRISIAESELFRKAMSRDQWGSTIETNPYQETVNKNLMDEELKFLRYKTTALNMISKAQHELERLVRMRNGESVSASEALEVNVSQ